MKKFPHDHRHIALRELLRKLRKETGLQQIELAAKLGRPQSYVSKYEIGERRLDWVDVYLITHALDIPLTEFAVLYEKALTPQ